MALIDPLSASIRPRRPRLARLRKVSLVELLAIGWLLLLVLGAFAVDVLPIPDPNSSDYDAYRASPSDGHWLGTDELGRDTLSRILHGARISLSVSSFSVALGLAVGVTLGLAAGYFRGLVDTAISIVADIILAFPVIILIMTIVAIRGASVTGLVVGLGVATVPAFYRMARAHTMTWSQRDFMTAARTLGARRGRLLFRELLPMVLAPLLSYALVIAALVIMAEGALSFLGYGVRPPSASWGSMISSGRQTLETDPRIVAAPAITLVLTVLSFNTVGNRLERRGQHRLEA